MKTTTNSTKGPSLQKAVFDSGQAREDTYRAQSDLRTLTEAETIKADPARMAAIHKISGAHAQALKTVAKSVGSKAPPPAKSASDTDMDGM